MSRVGLVLAFFGASCGASAAEVAWERTACVVDGFVQEHAEAEFRFVGDGKAAKWRLASDCNCRTYQMKLHIDRAGGVVTIQMPPSSNFTENVSIPLVNEAGNRVTLSIERHSKVPFSLNTRVLHFDGDKMRASCMITTLQEVIWDAVSNENFAVKIDGVRDGYEFQFFPRRATLPERSIIHVSGAFGEQKVKHSITLVVVRK